jgi:GTPase
VAVLTHGVDGEPLLDDGRGTARTAVFRHKHEIQSGHTSSISQSMLGYGGSGNVLNYQGVNSLTATEISAAAQKVLHFIDLCGHSRFLRTALYGELSLSFFPLSAFFCEQQQVMCCCLYTTQCTSASSTSKRVCT